MGLCSSSAAEASEPTPENEPDAIEVSCEKPPDAVPAKHSLPVPHLQLQEFADGMQKASRFARVSLSSGI